jgi:hypothetical protein
VAEKDALTASERANFEYRRDHISERLNPARKPVIAERVTKFLSAYPLVQRMPREQIPGFIEQHCQALSGLPEWAVAGAIDRILKGSTDPKYVPNPPEVRAEADELMRPFRDELRQVSEVLRAHVQPAPMLLEAERVWIVEDAMRKNGPFTGLSTEEEEAERRRKREQAEKLSIASSESQIARMRKAAGLPPEPKISPELQRKLEAMGGTFGAGVESDDQGGRADGGREP